MLRAACACSRTCIHSAFSLKVSARRWSLGIALAHVSTRGDMGTAPQALLHFPVCVWMHTKQCVRAYTCARACGHVSSYGDIRTGPRTCHPTLLLRMWSVLNAIEHVHMHVNMPARTQTCVQRYNLNDTHGPLPMSAKLPCAEKLDILLYLYLDKSQYTTQFIK